uniref:RNA-directed DNA polymerase n=1 Tax=Globodera rostochiensis TaxID=31243 RepID=A0A914HF90_GLORO
MVICRSPPLTRRRAATEGVVLNRDGIPLPAREPPAQNEAVQQQYFQPVQDLFLNQQNENRQIPQRQIFEEEEGEYSDSGDTMAEEELHNRLRNVNLNRAETEGNGQNIVGGLREDILQFGNLGENRNRQEIFQPRTSTPIFAFSAPDRNQISNAQRNQNVQPNNATVGQMHYAQANNAPHQRYENLQERVVRDHFAGGHQLVTTYQQRVAINPNHGQHQFYAPRHTNVGPKNPPPQFQNPPYAPQLHPAHNQAYPAYQQQIPVQPPVTQHHQMFPNMVQAQQMPNPPPTLPRSWQQHQIPVSQAVASQQNVMNPQPVQLAPSNLEYHLVLEKIPDLSGSEGNDGVKRFFKKFDAYTEEWPDRKRLAALESFRPQYQRPATQPQFQNFTASGANRTPMRETIDQNISNNYAQRQQQSKNYLKQNCLTVPEEDVSQVNVCLGKIELSPEIDEFFRNIGDQLGDTEGKKPAVGKIMAMKVGIVAIEAETMLDCGAQISLISPDFFVKLVKEKNLDLNEVQLAESCARILDVNGKPLECHASVSLPVQRKGIREPIMTTFHIAKAPIGFDLLVGTNALGELGFKLYDKPNQAFVNFEKVEPERKDFLTRNPSILSRVARDKSPTVSGNCGKRTNLLPVTNLSSSTVLLEEETHLGQVEEARIITIDELLHSPLIIANVITNNSEQRNGDEAQERGEEQEAKFGPLPNEDAEQLRNLLEKFATIFAKHDCELTQTNLVEHAIETENAAPIRPIVIVPKKDGSLRFCVDYRGVNSVTRKDSFPLPNIDNTLLMLGGKKYFTTLDFMSGYWQIRMDENSVEKTAFVTNFGLHEFVVMPFGLSNAVATFQRFMSRLFEGIIDDFVFVYIDDILIASETFEKHLEHLKAVFGRIKEAGLKLKVSKCHFCAVELPFLGHLLTREGIKMDADKAMPVTKLPIPTTKKELQSLLGFFTYYRKFIYSFGTVAAPLYRLLRDGVKFYIGEKEKEAIDELKRKVLSDVVLYFPDFEAAQSDPARQFIIMTDASKTGLAAVLCQPDPTNTIRPIYFALGNAANTKRNTARPNWKHSLSASGALHGEELPEIQDENDIAFIGAIKETAVQEKEDELQNRDEWIAETKQSSKNSSTLCDENGKMRLFVPAKFREELIRTRHEGKCAGHMSGKKLHLQISETYFWPNMLANCIQEHLKCRICAHTRTARAKEPPLNVVQSTEPLELVCMDILDVGPSLSNQKYICVIVDHFTKYVIAEPVPNKSAEAVAKVFVEKLVLIFGTPERIHSDRGKEFLNSTMEEISKTLGIKRSFTAGYDPKANGLAERINRILIGILKKSVSNTWTWDERLAYAVFSYNITPSSITGFSPFPLMFGRSARFPSDETVSLSVNPAYTIDQEGYIQLFRENLLNVLKNAKQNSEVAREKSKNWYDSKPGRNQNVQPNNATVGQMHYAQANNAPHQRYENLQERVVRDHFAGGHQLVTTYQQRVAINPNHGQHQFYAPRHTNVGPKNPPPQFQNPPYAPQLHPAHNQAYPAYQQQIPVQPPVTQHHQMFPNMVQAQQMPNPPPTLPRSWQQHQIPVSQAVASQQNVMNPQPVQLAPSNLEYHLVLEKIPDLSGSEGNDGVKRFFKKFDAYTEEWPDRKRLAALESFRPQYQRPATQPQFQNFTASGANRTPMRETIDQNISNNYAQRQQQSKNYLKQNCLTVPEEDVSQVNVCLGKIELSPEIDEFFRNIGDQLGDTEGKKPAVGKIMAMKVGIVAIEAETMLDCGAQISLISPDFFVKLVKEKNLDLNEVQLAESCARILDVNGKPLECHASVSLPVQRKGIREPIMTTFHIAKAPIATIIEDFGIERRQGISEILASSAESQEIRVQPSVGIVENGRICIPVTNLSSSTVLLEEETHLGQVEEARIITIDELLHSPLIIANVITNNSEQRNGDEAQERGEEQEAKFGPLPNEDAEQLRNLLEKFATIFAKHDCELTQTNLVEHAIETENAAPIRPIVIVPKKDGSLRFCVDYRGVNSVTRKDSFPLPNIDNTLLMLGGKKYFTTLDFMSGYWQIRMDENSVEKTAFVTNFGLHEFVVMPFGLSNAVATFQRFMSRLFEGIIDDFVFVYIDDILIASETFEKHLEHLKAVFGRIKEAGLKLKVSKCHFCAVELPFLGHLLTREGIKMDADKAMPVTKLPIPTTKKELQSLLGFFTYYRKFIYSFGTVAAPLYRLLRDGVKFYIGEKEKEAIDELKRKVLSDVVLYFPDFEAAQSDPARQFIIMTDASKTGLAAVLCQPDPTNTIRPIYFALGNAANTKRNTARPNWKHSLSASGALHGEELPEIQDENDIAFIGAIKETAVQEKEDELQNRDEWIAETKQSSKNSSTLCDENGKMRLFVPAKFREELIRTRHEGKCAGHMSGKKLHLQISETYFWPNMLANCIQEHLKCRICAHTRTARAKEPPLNVVQSTEPLELVCMDILDVGPSLSNQKYICVIVDHFTKYVIAEPVPNKSAEAVAKVFVEKLVLIFGTPERIHSDRGKEFLNSTMEEISKTLGIKRSFTAGYDPKANGLAERINRILIGILKKSVSNTWTWDERLAYAVFSYNITPSSITGFSPFPLMFGRSARFPSDETVSLSVNPAYTIDQEGYIQLFRENLLNVLKNAKQNSEVAREKSKNWYDSKPGAAFY